MTNNNEILTYITQSFDLKRQGYYKQAIEMLYKALAIAIRCRCPPDKQMPRSPT